MTRQFFRINSVDQAAEQSQSTCRARLFQRKSIRLFAGTSWRTFDRCISYFLREQPRGSRFGQSPAGDWRVRWAARTERRHD